METLTDRMTRYLLKRLRRRAVLALYERAVDAGLLASAFIGGEEQKGTVWKVHFQAWHMLTGNREQDRRIVARMLGVSSPPLHRGDEPATFIVPDEDVVDGVVTFECRSVGPLDEQQTGRRGKTRRAKAGSGAAGAVPGISFPYVASLLREHLPPPNPVHVAVALLVARAVGTSRTGMASLIEPLRPAAPFVLLKAPVPRFELCVGMMLEDGLILPFRAALEDVLRENPISGRYRHQHSTVNRRKLKSLSGIAVENTDDRDLRKQLRQSLLDEPMPILLIDETELALTLVVTETADLVLECAGIDREMIAELLHVCVGIPPKQSLVLMDDRAFDPERLTLDDIALAVRPGRAAEQTLSVLAMLAERSAAEEEEEKDDKEAGRRKQRSGKGKASETSSRVKKDTGKKKPQDVGVEVIEPVPMIDGDVPAGGTAGTPPSKSRLLSVETLAGYGEARNWACDLKADLALWKDGRLRWDEMSTRLLLSGPPGTGKTTFARALCNTLQVPLLATSVGHWLEPGYLGDVLQRMSGAFTFAVEKAPAILFIDELDNIGKRQGAGNRNYDDYWSSLVNRLLELLDGASKSEGIIVIGATNLPDRIDSALLRSGRLETHVRIPMPDTEALIGILGHHLGADLEAVLASAPAATSPRRLRRRNRSTGSRPCGVHRSQNLMRRKGLVMTDTVDHSSSTGGLRPLALLAMGRTGADIERLVREVRRRLRRVGRAMAWADLETALRDGQAAISGDLRWRASVHEAGHALVYMMTGVAEVTAASIGLHGLGMVATVANDHLPQNEDWLMNKMAALLAGRTAELLVIGEVLAGAGGGDESDLARATVMALAAETQLGFSAYQPLLCKPPGMAMSDLALDRQLADRVNARLLAAEAIARDLLKQHRDLHHAIATRLNATGIMSGDELREMIGGAKGAVS